MLGELPALLSMRPPQVWVERGEIILLCELKVVQRGPVEQASCRKKLKLKLKRDLAHSPARKK